MQQGSYRDTSFGTTDGTFQQKCYFNCKDGCGLFVSLDRIYPIDKMPTQSKIIPSEPTQQGKPTYGPSISKKESGIDPAQPPRFQIGQRVSFYNNKGVEHFGTVGWTGSKIVSRKFDYVVIGIKTVSNFPLYAWL